MRALILVMDSVGIGGAPDASSYGDDGADTVGHIAEACAAGRADNGQRQGPLQVPYLAALGLGDACQRATGRKPPGLTQRAGAGAAFGIAHEQSRGKDTPSGHWEIAGVPVPFEWGYFPRTVPTFPPDLIEQLCASAGLPGILGDCHASGTEIIAELGETHMQTGRPICYTSADSVFQIAAHEEAFGLDRLYQLCDLARPLVDRFNIGRVIARPFVGGSSADFRRTANRRDYAVPPPEPTILDIASAEQRHVVTIGKIADIFAHRGTGHNLKGESNDVLFTRMLEGLDTLEDGGLLFANFVDFDTLYGHRRDIAGYARALEAFDARLPELLNALRTDDLLIITADHGCDPTWSGSDHTRESVPVLIANGRSAGPIGARSSFADIGATVAQQLRLTPTCHGSAFW
ncbi:phosphopentomutase [Bradyrhizobium sp. ORS 375]|uniref:phosphopentomutase n=1 Tax=Bradyrhizobium sp. (strain ORS 375) TaxID=566679 RepID=UPI0002405E0A|nr:phosphopentomutase [Bradyrhizobium sp. ORS 375]CCD94288.1 phosphopentomutase [Bradyrhizobium sp. ORS 375]